jgi:hypothetical protein
MQVNCARCSRPISVTDVIQSSNGRLQHLDCARSGGLTPKSAPYSSSTPRNTPSRDACPATVTSA